MPHREGHRSERIGWLRAAVLGANDGIVSTASLVVGVAAAESTRQHVLVAGVAGLVAGALSMAAGEYVSVSSQADTERADLQQEQRELAADPQAEEDELTGIYLQRGSGAGSRSRGRATTDGEGSAGRPRTGRTRPDRRTRRPPAAGRACVGGDVRHRSGRAGADDPARAFRRARWQRDRSLAVVSLSHSAQSPHGSAAHP